MLTQREQEILRRYGGWLLAHILTSPDAEISHAKTSFYGCSGFTVEGVEHWMQTTAKGIELGFRYGEPATDVLTWGKVKAHAKSVPAHVLDQIRAANRACGEHQRAWKPFAASAEAVGCGRCPEIGPPTRAQALYADEYDAWEREVMRPHYARSHDLTAALNAALDLAFPSLNDHEPTDLLDLLESA